MIKDPHGKGNGPTQYNDPIFRGGKEKGNINTTKDFSSGFDSQRSRIIYMCVCLLPYIGICVLVYLEGLEALGLIMLALPLVLLSIFWFIKKKVG